MAVKKTNWKNEPDDHDYAAAENYLSLLLPPPVAKRITAKLQRAAIANWKAKDILRASRLPILPRDNFHVSGDLKKVEAGARLSPVLLVRGRLSDGVPLTIADGYHRICASWYLDEDMDIPCRLVHIT